MLSVKRICAVSAVAAVEWSGSLPFTTLSPGEGKPPECAAAAAAVSDEGLCKEAAEGKGGVVLEAILADAVISMGVVKEEQEEEEEAVVWGAVTCKGGFLMEVWKSGLPETLSISLIPSSLLVFCWHVTGEGERRGVGQWFCVVGTDSPALMGKRSDIFVVWPVSAGSVASPIRLPLVFLPFIGSPFPTSAAPALTR